MVYVGLNKPVYADCRTQTAIAHHHDKFDTLVSLPKEIIMNSMLLFGDLLAQYGLKEKCSSLQIKGVPILYISYVLCANFLYINPEYRLFILILVCLLPIIIGMCIFLLFFKEFHKKLDKNDRYQFLNSFFPFFKIELILSNNTTRYVGTRGLYITNMLWIVMLCGVWTNTIQLDDFSFILSFVLFTLFFSLVTQVNTFFILLHLYYFILKLTRS